MSWQPTWHQDCPDAGAPFVLVEIPESRIRYSVWFAAGQPVWIARFATCPDQGWPIGALAPDSEWAAAAEAARAFVRGFTLPAVAS